VKGIRPAKTMCHLFSEFLFCNLSEGKKTKFTSKTAAKTQTVAVDTSRHSLTMLMYYRFALWGQHCWCTTTNTTLLLAGIIFSETYQTEDSVTVFMTLW